MNRQKNHIEDLFRKEFEHFEVKPSGKVWKAVQRDLFLRRFLHFNPGNFNIYYISAIILTGVIALMTIKSNRSSREETPVPAADLITILPPHTDQNFTDTAKIEPVRSLKQPSKDVPSSTEKIEAVKTGPQVTPSQRPEIIPPTAASPESQAERPEAAPETFVPGRVPLSYFTLSAREGCVPLTVSFLNHSDNGSIFSWNFGDGGTSSEKNPSYIYDEPGTYFVNLSVTSSNGEITAFTDSVHVYPLPEIRFDVDPTAVPGSGQPVYFYNYSKGADYFEWNFGDGNTSSEKEPSHYYEKQGEYDIILIGQSVYGCRDTVVLKNVFSENLPDILFPTAFTPDMNGPSDGYYSVKDPENDIFHPMVGEEVAEYQLRIFNRTGILVFESNDINIGWDGYYHQKLLPQGVYVWKARGRFTNGRSFVKMGDVTLLWTRER